MADAIRVDFQPFGLPKGGDAVVFVGDDGKLADRVAETLGRETSNLIAKTAKIERFKGKPNSAFAVPAPDGSKLDRVIVVGVGGEKERAKHDWRVLGGFIAGKVSGRTATVLADVPGLEATPEAIAEMALGARLRAYKFDRYKTKKKTDGNGEDSDTPTKLAFAAINSFTVGLARELASEGIRVNALMPGLVDTEIHAAAGVGDRLEALIPTVPMGRIGTSEECAEAIVWLMSNEAAYMTGALIPISGGR
jgi:leucyl aminopeptidase